VPNFNAKENYYTNLGILQHLEIPQAFPHQGIPLASHQGILQAYHLGIPLGNHLDYYLNSDSPETEINTIIVKYPAKCQSSYFTS
jgi:hypothetical protein